MKKYTFIFFFEKYGQRGIKKSSDNKNSPEMNVLEPDLISQKNSASNSQ